MAVVDQSRATLDELMRAEGKTELIGGRVVQFMATGRMPNRVAFRITRSLDDHAVAVGLGEAYTDNMGFAVPELPSGRESFSPDASYFAGPFLDPPMKFIHAAPSFAVKVRSENDYGPAAEIEMAAKRVDYFLAGTPVVWDVDTEAELIRVFRHSDPANPTIYRRGDVAEAEPAVPGWRVEVDRLFA